MDRKELLAIIDLAKISQLEVYPLDQGPFKMIEKLANHALSLESKLEIACDTLESISCLDAPEQIEASSWLLIPHTACAETLATDTFIARQTLAKIKGETG